MSEVKDQEVENLYEGFGEEEGYGDAVVRQKEEEAEKGGKKAKLPRMDLKKALEVRLAPLAPGTIKRQSGKRFGASGWFMPRRSILFPLEIKGRDKPLYVSINAITQFDEFAGKYDPVTTYQFEAKDQLEKQKRKDDAKKITEGSYNGGLKFGNENIAYGFIKSEDGDPNLHIGSFSNTLVSRLETQKMNTWKRWESKGENKKCPISSLKDGCFVEIDRIKGEKVDYTIQIITDDNLPINDGMIKQLLDAPRLNEYVHYSRYQYEATLYYLKAYDEMLGLNVCESEKFLAACKEVEIILDEKKDETHFDPTKYAKNKSEGGDSEEVEEDDRIFLEDIEDELAEITGISFSEICEIIEAGEVVEIDETDKRVKSLRRELSAYIKENGVDIKLLRATKYPTPKAVVDVHNEYNEED